MSYRTPDHDGDPVQPFLHDLLTCVRAPTCVLSGADGQIRAAGAQGLFHGDRRHIAELVVAVDGREPVPVAHCMFDDSRARFVGALIGVGDPIPDPTVRLERTRQATAHGMVDQLTIVNDSRRAVRPVLTARMTCDMASVSAAKHGTRVALLPTDAGSGARWTGEAGTTELRVGATDGTADIRRDSHAYTVCWVPDIPSHRTATLTVTVDASGAPAPVFTGAPRPSWVGQVHVRSGHGGLTSWVSRSVDDLATLLLTDGAGADDVFAAAGAPWFLTLFGRDSLWTARFALPVDVDVAAGTLRTLARRQATSFDVDTAAEPGKILHEVRAVAARADGHDLPPLYYGSVDATPLWISLLHDAWCWGMADADVAGLLDPLQAAVGWMVAHDGFLAYRDESGHGLANQGWKDSGDSIQDGAGVIAEPPITLCEVQGYAYRAALDGARLLDAFGRDGGAAARAFGSDLQARFRSAFWTSGPHGPFPAVALDGAGRVVDSLTSNIGHLLTTGILDAEEVAVVAAHLERPTLDSGYGLRTLAADHPMFNPLGYHSGSVWPHDTAIAIDGLAATGHGAAAAALAGGLLAAAGHFDDRLPELFGGWAATAGPPIDYPAACRPQAWAAGCAIVVLRAALGLRVDVPSGMIAVRPDPSFAAWFPLDVLGLRVGQYHLDVFVDSHGRATVDTDAPYAVTVI